MKKDSPKDRSDPPKAPTRARSKGGSSDDDWRKEQADRIALIEERAREEERRISRAHEYGHGAATGANFDPGAPSRFRKLRALSRFLLLASYLLLGLVFAGVGVTVWLWREGTIPSDGVFALAVLGWLIVGGFVYCLFKFLGELAWLLADLGDHQLDARNLLIDLRDDLQRSLRAKGSGS